MDQRTDGWTHLLIESWLTTKNDVNDVDTFTIIFYSQNDYGFPYYREMSWNAKIFIHNFAIIYSRLVLA